MLGSQQVLEASSLCLGPVPAAIQQNEEPNDLLGVLNPSAEVELALVFPSVPRMEIELEGAGAACHTLTFHVGALLCSLGLPNWQK